MLWIRRCFGQHADTGEKVEFRGEFENASKTKQLHDAGACERSGVSIIDRAAFQHRFLPADSSSPAKPLAAASFTNALYEPQPSSLTGPRLAAACAVLSLNGSSRRAKKGIVVHGPGEGRQPPLSLKVLWVAHRTGAPGGTASGADLARDTDAYQAMLEQLLLRDSSLRRVLEEGCRASFCGAFCAIKHKPAPGSPLESQLGVTHVEISACTLRLENGHQIAGLIIAVQSSPGPGSGGGGGGSGTTPSLTSLSGPMSPSPLAGPFFRGMGPPPLPSGSGPGLDQDGASEVQLRPRASGGPLSGLSGLLLSSPAKVASLERPDRLIMLRQQWSARQAQWAAAAASAASAAAAPAGPQSKQGAVPPAQLEVASSGVDLGVRTGGGARPPLSPSADSTNQRMRLAAAARAVAAEVLPASIMVFTCTKGNALAEVIYLNSRAREYLCLGGSGPIPSSCPSRAWGSAGGLAGLPARSLLAAILELEQPHIVRQLHAAAATEKGFFATIKVPAYIDARGLALEHQERRQRRQEAGEGAGQGEGVQGEDDAGGDDRTTGDGDEDDAGNDKDDDDDDEEGPVTGGRGSDLFGLGLDVGGRRTPLQTISDIAEADELEAEADGKPRPPPQQRQKGKKLKKPQQKQEPLRQGAGRGGGQAARRLRKAPSSVLAITGREGSWRGGRTASAVCARERSFLAATSSRRGSFVAANPAAVVVAHRTASMRVGGSGATGAGGLAPSKSQLQSSTHYPEQYIQPELRMLSRAVLSVHGEMLRPQTAGSLGRPGPLSGSRQRQGGPGPGDPGSSGAGAGGSSWGPQMSPRPSRRRLQAAVLPEGRSLDPSEQELLQRLVHNSATGSGSSSPLWLMAGGKRVQGATSGPRPAATQVTTPAATEASFTAAATAEDLRTLIGAEAGGGGGGGGAVATSLRSATVATAAVPALAPAAAAGGSVLAARPKTTKRAVRRVMSVAPSQMAARLEASGHRANPGSGARVASAEAATGPPAEPVLEAAGGRPPGAGGGAGGPGIQVVAEAVCLSEPQRLVSVMTEPVASIAETGEGELDGEQTPKEPVTREAAAPTPPAAPTAAAQAPVDPRGAAGAPHEPAYGPFTTPTLAPSTPTTFGLPPLLPHAPAHRHPAHNRDADMLVLEPTPFNSQLPDLDVSNMADAPGSRAPLVPASALAMVTKALSGGSFPDSAPAAHAAVPIPAASTSLDSATRRGKGWGPFAVAGGRQPSGSTLADPRLQGLFRAYCTVDSSLQRTASLGRSPLSVGSPRATVQGSQPSVSSASRPQLGGVVHAQTHLGHLGAPGHPDTHCPPHSAHPTVNRFLPAGAFRGGRDHGGSSSGRNADGYCAGPGYCAPDSLTQGEGVGRSPAARAAATATGHSSSGSGSSGAAAAAGSGGPGSDLARLHPPVLTSFEQASSIFISCLSGRASSSGTMAVWGGAAGGGNDNSGRVGWPNGGGGNGSRSGSGSAIGGAGEDVLSSAPGVATGQSYGRPHVPPRAGSRLRMSVDMPLQGAALTAGIAANNNIITANNNDRLSRGGGAGDGPAAATAPGPAFSPRASVEPSYQVWPSLDTGVRCGVSVGQMDSNHSVAPSSSNALSGACLASGVKSIGGGAGGGGASGAYALHATLREGGRWDGLVQQPMADLAPGSTVLPHLRHPGPSGGPTSPYGSTCWSGYGSNASFALSNSLPTGGGPGSIGGPLPGPGLAGAPAPLGARGTLPSNGGLPLRAKGKGNSVRARVHALLDQAEQAEMLRGGSGTLAAPPSRVHSHTQSHSLALIRMSPGSAVSGSTSGHPGHQAPALRGGGLNAHPTYLRPSSGAAGSGALMGMAGCVATPPAGSTAVSACLPPALHAGAISLSARRSSLHIVPYDMLVAASASAGGVLIHPPRHQTCEPCVYGGDQPSPLLARAHTDRVSHPGSSLHLHLLMSVDDPHAQAGRDAPGGGSGGLVGGGGTTTAELMLRLGNSGGVGALAGSGSSVHGSAAVRSGGGGTGPGGRGGGGSGGGLSIPLELKLLTPSDLGAMACGDGAGARRGASPPTGGPNPGLGPPDGTAAGQAITGRGGVPLGNAAGGGGGGGDAVSNLSGGVYGSRAGRLASVVTLPTPTSYDDDGTNVLYMMTGPLPNELGAYDPATVAAAAAASNTAARCSCGDPQLTSPHPSCGGDIVPGEVGPGSSGAFTLPVTQQQQQQRVAAPVAWCQLRARTSTTVDGRRVLMLMLSDVTKQVQNQERVATLVEQEHRILEALFPRHVIAYLTTPTNVDGDDGEDAAPFGTTNPSLGPGSTTTSNPTALAPSHGSGPSPGPGSGARRSSRTASLARRSSLELSLVGCAGVGDRSLLRGKTQLRQLAQQHHQETVKVSRLATEHKMVTILFSDIVGFTAFSRQVPALTVMRFLNELYQKLDALLDIYKVYKVETIGDCYVVAGGLVRYDSDGLCSVLPEGETDELHAVRVMEFAKAMLRASREVRLPTTGEPVQVRLGLHSGPAMSGVVGSKMPRFTVFGETVEAAHKMEASGRPGRIHVSGVTRALLRREQWEATEGVQIEGRGLLDTYLWCEEADEDDSHKQRVMNVYL